MQCYDLDAVIRVFLVQIPLLIKLYFASHGVVADVFACYITQCCHGVSDPL